jgi:hypothetical protein
MSLVAGILLVEEFLVCAIIPMSDTIQFFWSMIGHAFMPVLHETATDKSR